jgi:hypothetical protein
MSDERPYTVLGFGEKFVSSSEKALRPPPNGPKGRPIDEARRLLGQPVQAVVATIELMPKENRLDEVVVELRLDEKFLAKSYHPDDLLQATGLKVRGVGSWVQTLAPERVSKRRKKKDKDAGALRVKTSRSLFVSGSVPALRKLQQVVASTVSEEIDNDIGKLEDIRLPSAEERLRVQQDAGGQTIAIEIVLYSWDEKLRQEAIARVRDVLTKGNVPPTRVRVKSYPEGPTFIAAVVPHAVLPKLAALNFLRITRSLPRLHLSREVVRRAVPGMPMAVQPVLPLPRVAIFDGGYAAGHPVLDAYVTAKDCTPQPPIPEYVDHGTAVASAAIFGPLALDGSVPPPTCRVLSFRVLPEAHGDDALELEGLVEALEAEVPKLPKDVRVVNLSLGPPGPIDDDIPSHFSYALDRLAREHNVLFVTAVGNDGNDPHGHTRIQAPSDAVNNLAVGAYRLDSQEKPEHANYSCQGPGRSGGMVKPDVVAFGGCATRPFYMYCAQAGMVVGERGTSYAAPCVSSVAAGLVPTAGPQTTLSAEALRALIIHSAQQVPGVPTTHMGHGIAARTVEEALRCTPKRVSVLYQGHLSPMESWKLPFLLPPEFNGGGLVNFAWTVVLSPEVELGSPSEYALGGVEIVFRPHSEVYTYRAPPDPQNPKANRKTESLHSIRDEARIAELTLQGWTPSLHPKTSGKKTGLKEEALRLMDGKWETVVRAGADKYPASVSEPLLTLTVLGRRGWGKKNPALRARYAAVLTVDAPKYGGDLYADVRAYHPVLVPLTATNPQLPSGRLRT